MTSRPRRNVGERQPPAPYAERARGVEACPPRAARFSAWCYDWCGRALNPRQGLLKEITSFVGDTTGLDVLEVGAGTCRVCGELARLHPDTRVLAADISAAGLARGQSKGCVKTCVAATEELPALLQGMSFDLAIAVETLHHHQSRIVALEAITQLLRPGGRLVIQEADASHGSFWKYWVVDRTDRISSVLQKMPYTVPRYFARSEWEDILRIMGYKTGKHLVRPRNALFLLEAWLLNARKGCQHALDDPVPTA